MRIPAKIALFGIALVTVANASPISGQFNFSGTATVTATRTNFDVTGPKDADPNEGNILFGQGDNLGDFAFLNGFPPIEFGDVDDRDAFLTPTGADLNVPRYIEFYDRPDLNFVLRGIVPGTFGQAECGLPEANGQQCTPPPQFGAVSPYNLTNSEQDNVISARAFFRAVGDVYVNGVLGGAFEADFTAQFQGQSYQDILATISAGGTNQGTVTTPFLAEVRVSAIPEPSTIGLAGAALFGLAAFGRRFRK